MYLLYQRGFEATASICWIKKCENDDLLCNEENASVVLIRAVCNNHLSLSRGLFPLRHGHRLPFYASEIPVRWAMRWYEEDFAILEPLCCVKYPT